MDCLPYVFYESVVSMLEQKDLKTICSNFNKSVLQSFCQDRLEYHRGVTLHIHHPSITNSGQAIFIVDQNSHRVDIRSKFYIDAVIVAGPTEKDYNEKLVYSEGLLERALKTYSKFFDRKVSFDMDDDMLHDRQFAEMVLRSNLAKIPYSDINMAYVSHLSDQFLNRQVQFGMLKSLFLLGNIPSTTLECVVDLLAQAQFKYLSLTNMEEVEMPFVEKLLQKWKSTTNFGFSIYGRASSSLCFKKLLKKNDDMWVMKHPSDRYLETVFSRSVGLICISGHCRP
ncbi:hypothetical protein QR680_010738 [Steinernema hermaphroditum]|uniref:Uncharacterized protein n=1 Tax=Steinernema hermaphroditum TaxID=289476 RepID=A0AA39MCA7_9BILA|nr:hypothetical protein QR680_010738 [Steinernema hermaphroditum]